MRGKEGKVNILMIAAVAAATTGSAVEQSQADETNKVTQLAPVVVYGSRIESSAAEMPNAVGVYDAAAISRSGARDLPELLDKVVNLQVRTLNANPLQTQIAMRGFGENSFGRVKVIVDGEEVNCVDMDAPNLARIPLGSVERVEVIHGASPVLHGDGAVAGVINIVTDTRDYTKKTKVSVRGGSYGTFGANVQTKGGFEEDGLLYFASYDYVRSDGYRDRTGYDMHSFSASLRKNFDNGSTVGIKANYFNSLFEMPGSLSFDQWKGYRKYARYDNDWCRLWNYGFAIDSKIAIAEDQWLYIDGAFSVKHRQANWGDYGYSNDYDLYSCQISPRYVNEKDIFDFGSKFTLGYDFRYDRYNVRDRSGYNNPKYHFDRERHALFAEEEFSLTEELSFIAGARGEYIDNRWRNYSGLNRTTSYDFMGDFEIGVVYRPVEDMKIFVKGTRFHRSAFCDEMNYTKDGKFLEPETGVSLDVGFEYAFAKEFKFDATGYWSIMKDEIFYNPYASQSAWGWSGYNSNSPGRTERLGFDTGLSWCREKTAEASIRYSFVNSRFRDGQYEGETIPLVPQNRVRAEVGVWILDDLEIKGGYRFVSLQYLMSDFNNEQDRLSGYSLFDVGVYYVPSWAEGLKVSLVVDNLLDRNYCDFAGWSDYSGAYYYPACGRSFMLAVSYEF